MIDQGTSIHPSGSAIFHWLARRRNATWEGGKADAGRATRPPLEPVQVTSGVVGRERQSFGDDAVPESSSARDPDWGVGLIGLSVRGGVERDGLSH